MGRWCVVLACVLVVGCVRSQSILCNDGRTCPIGTACDEVNHQCVHPDALTACVQHPDGDPCMAGTSTEYVCKNEICVAPRCGDELVTPGEQCDASTPVVGTCVDAAYDYGVLGCDETCSPSTDSCHRLGWHYVNVPGFGGITAIWEDGADVWVANQNGVIHFDGDEWSGPDVISGTKWWVRGIWASGNTVIAVGSRGTKGVLARSLDHGLTWNEMEVPELMRAVWGRSANEVYAVGDGGAIYKLTSTWAKVTSPTAAQLNAVWGNGQIVAAVGEAGTIVASMGGNNFIQVRGNSSTESLLGVWGSSATDVFAVGFIDGSSVTPQLVRYKDGGITFPALPAEITGKLLGVSGRSGNEMYIAGEGTVLASDGVGWRTMEVPTGYPLSAIHAGTRKAYAAYQSQFFIEFEGAAWVAPNSGDPTTAFEDVWTDGNEIVAVGECAFQQYGGAGAVGNSLWTRLAAPTGGPCPGACPFLLAVWGSSTNDVYAGGPYGHFFHRDGGVWSCAPRPLGDSKWIWAIWGTGPNDVWVGGGMGDDSGVGLAHYNGNTWTDLSSQVMPHAQVIRDIWGTGPNDVYFVGKPGAIIHWNGSTFTKMQSPTPNVLHTILGVGPNDVYAAGDLGVILHYDGTAWSIMNVPPSTSVSTTDGIFDLCARAKDDIFAIGGRTMLHYNGAAWAPIVRPDGDSGKLCLAGNAQVLTGGELGAGSRLVGRLLP
jgi:hypothetical protein